MAKLKAIRGDGRLAQFAPLFRNRLLQRTANLATNLSRESGEKRLVFWSHEKQSEYRVPGDPYFTEDTLKSVPFWSGIFNCWQVTKSPPRPLLSSHLFLFVLLAFTAWTL